MRTTARALPILWPSSCKLTKCLHRSCPTSRHGDNLRFCICLPGALRSDHFCGDDFSSLWFELDVSTPRISSAMGRLRKALLQAKLSSAQAPPSASPPPPTPSPANSSLANSWVEHAPPRLDQATVQRMVQAFKDAFPGEHLDSDAMPSSRLLTKVHRWFQPGNAITWVPCSCAFQQNSMKRSYKAKQPSKSAPKCISSAPLSSTTRRSCRSTTCASALPGCIAFKLSSAMLSHLQRCTSATPQGVRQKGP